jgi:hypothetical protein
MNDPSLRDALLKEDSGLPVATKLDVLHGLVKAEERRGRRLALWTVSVWVLWAAMALAFALSGTTQRAPERPAGAVPAPGPVLSGPQMSVSGVVGVLLVLVGFLCLPAVVMVPWIVMYLSRRSASISQIRAGLASIEAQLKLSARTAKPPHTDHPS